jgi:hypothetical protein
MWAAAAGSPRVRRVLAALLLLWTVVLYYRGGPAAPRIRQARPVVRSASATGDAAAGGGDGRDGGAASPPFVAPAAWPYRRHQDGYDTWVFTDAFLKADTIHVISMVYVRWPMSTPDKLRVSVPALGVARAPFAAWHVRDEYESSAIGLFTDARLSSMASVAVVFHYEDESRDFVLHRVHTRRGARYAACALFHTDAHLMEMWVSYWWLLGVDTFYMYYNGKAEDIPALAARAAALRPAATFHHWPFDYWVADAKRPHHGQPMAVNDCFYRYRDRHEFLVMYDLVRRAAAAVRRGAKPGGGRGLGRRRHPERRYLCAPRATPPTHSHPLPVPHSATVSSATPQDELLVFPGHDDLPSFHASITVPWKALRSQSTWTRIELEAVGAAYNALTIDHIGAAPLTRTDIDYRREKYVVNTSYGADVGITIVNVHGVYQVETGIGAPVPGGPPQTLMGPEMAYHFHFVNVGRDRTRDKFVDHPTPDGRAMEIVKAGLARRGRPEKRPEAGKGG